MKLNFLHNTEKSVAELKETVLYHELDLNDIDVPRPLGLSVEEWTPELKDHLKDLKVRRPKLYQKIVNGH
jgi:hypothetical protein